MKVLSESTVVTVIRFVFDIVLAVERWIHGDIA